MSLYSALQKVKENKMILDSMVRRNLFGLAGMIMLDAEFRRRVLSEKQSERTEAIAEFDLPTEIVLKLVKLQTRSQDEFIREIAEIIK